MGNTNIGWSPLLNINGDDVNNVNLLNKFSKLK